MIRTALCILPILAAMTSPPVFADVFQIDRDNLGGILCSGASSCGTITVTGTSTLHVAISLNSPNLIFGNNDAFGFNVVGSTSGVSISNISNGLFTCCSSSGNEDGWGTFNFRIDGPPASSGVSSLNFDVTRTGTAFTAPSDIEAGATGGNGFTVFALHVKNPNLTGTNTGYAGVTLDNGGGGGGGGNGSVPEPSSVILLSSLVGIIAISFRKKVLA